MRNRFVHTVLWLTIAALLLCAGCQPPSEASTNAPSGTTAAPTNPTTSAAPTAPSTPPADTFTLNMTATLLMPNGSGLNSTTLTITGTYPPEAAPGQTVSNAPIDMQLALGNGIGYFFGANNSLVYSKLPASGTGEILHIPMVIFDPSTGAPTFVTLGLDLENEAFICVFRDYPNQYIVASTDRSQAPEDILDHFWVFVYANTPADQPKGTLVRATLFSDNGSVAKAFSLTFHYTLTSDPDKGRDTFSFRIPNRKSLPYEVKLDNVPLMTLPDMPYLVTSTTSFNVEKSDFRFIWVVADLEKGFFLLYWPEDNAYLVASTDERTPSQQILDHFSAFVTDYMQK